MTEKQSENIRLIQAQAQQKAQLLIEMLPWIKLAYGKTIVIKYGGAAMTDPALRRAVMQDIILLKLVGLNPIIVHGGGKDINRLCEALGLPVEFENGFRVTPPEVMEVVKMTLIGKVNQELVSELNQHGQIAVGLNGADGQTVQAEQFDPAMGAVGRVTAIDTTLLVDLIEHDYIPVIASVATGAKGEAYNVNADVVAGEVATAIGAHKAVFLTDVDGLYRDFNDKSSLIDRITVSELEALLAAGNIATGMIPKIESCIKVVKAGVGRAHILNGTLEHSMLLELFTDLGVGTMVMPDDGGAAEARFDNYPIDGFAEKLQ
ncbi:MAG: acetylglutamate kinase [Coriobacteriales bacterium]|jgi:acetylglutamate kinase|nr:acetylglutamate kinase [Coriobacteriales bacterium]